MTYALQSDLALAIPPETLLRLSADDPMATVPDATVISEMLAAASAEIDAALADPQATTVVFMGKRTFPALAAMLTEAGLSPETPALLAEAVGHPHQSLHHSTIGALALHLADARSDQPALILYGPLATP